jgi:hypothetical protein
MYAVIRDQKPVALFTSAAAAINAAGSKDRSRERELIERGYIRVGEFDVLKRGGERRR